MRRMPRRFPSPERRTRIRRRYSAVGGSRRGGIWPRPGFRRAACLPRQRIRDQWTVDGSHRRDSPLFRFVWLDPRKPVLYISSHTGAAVQLTTGRQRFWNWLGAIPHWIYFTALRERPHLWTAVVVWAAALGSFLTLMGVYIGFLQYSRSRPRRQWSPYRGFLIWHHVPGLAFGLLALSWVLSGLVSMNPWGFLDESGPRPDQVRLRGDPMSGRRWKMRF